MLLVGLNPYGTAYTIGLQAAGTPRANPRPTGFAGFIALAERIGARSIELELEMVAPLAAPELDQLRGWLTGRLVTPILSVGPSPAALDEAIAFAPRLGAQMVRIGLTPVLQGDRAFEPRWEEYVAAARRMLRDAAPRAAERGLALAIEDHQDFTSAELVAMCQEAGPNVGICFDTGNALSVGEEPLAFTRAIAPYVRHLHLKDYRTHWSDDGYRLVRCSMGDGAIPLRGIEAIRSQHHARLTASIEVGALNARHIRLFTPQWWQGYPPRAAADLGAALAAARVQRLPDDADWRTPWELEQEPQAIIDHEMALFDRSAARAREWGWLD